MAKKKTGEKAKEKAEKEEFKIKADNHGDSQAAEIPAKGNSLVQIFFNL